MVMIRPRGKASRIFKKIVSLEGNMPKKQGFSDKLDESLGERNKGKKKQSMKSRRKESKGMEKSIKRRSYAVVKTMDKGHRKKKGA